MPPVEPSRAPATPPSTPTALCRLARVGRGTRPTLGLDPNASPNRNAVVAHPVPSRPRGFARTLPTLNRTSLEAAKPRGHNNSHDKARNAVLPSPCPCASARNRPLSPPIHPIASDHPRHGDGPSPRRCVAVGKSPPHRRWKTAVTQARDPPIHPNASHHPCPASPSTRRAAASPLENPRRIAAGKQPSLKPTTHPSTQTPPTTPAPPPPPLAAPLRRRWKIPAASPLENSRHSSPRPTHPPKRLPPPLPRLPLHSPRRCVAVGKSPPHRRWLTNPTRCWKTKPGRG